MAAAGVYGGNFLLLYFNIELLLATNATEKIHNTLVCGSIRHTLALVPTPPGRTRVTLRSVQVGSPEPAKHKKTPITIQKCKTKNIFPK